jgi:hypothetical protein
MSPRGPSFSIPSVPLLVLPCLEVLEGLGAGGVEACPESAVDHPLKEGKEMDDAGGVIMEGDEMGMLFLDEVDKTSPDRLGIGRTEAAQMQVLAEEAGVFSGTPGPDPVLDIGQQLTQQGGTFPSGMFSRREALVEDSPDGLAGDIGHVLVKDPLREGRNDPPLQRGGRIAAGDKPEDGGLSLEAIPVVGPSEQEPEEVGFRMVHLRGAPPEQMACAEAVLLAGQDPGTKGEGTPATEAGRIKYLSCGERRGLPVVGKVPCVTGGIAFLIGLLKAFKVRKEEIAVGFQTAEGLICRHGIIMGDGDTVGMTVHESPHRLYDAPEAVFSEEGRQPVVSVTPGRVYKGVCRYPGEVEDVSVVIHNRIPV